MGYGNNTNAKTKEHCEELFDLAFKEYYNRNYIGSMEVLTKLQPIVRENNFIDLDILTLNLMGIIHEDLLAYGKAMELFLEVYDLAIKSHNLRIESMALNNIATIYEANNETPKALEHLKKAYDISLKLNDSTRIGEIAMHIARIAVMSEDIALAEQYITIANNAQSDDKRLLDYIQITMADLLFLKKEYAAAETFALSIERNVDQLLKNTLSFVLSKIYRQKGDVEKAIFYLQQILKEKPTAKEKIIAYEQLSELYQDNNLFVLALQYKDSAMQAKDLLYEVSNKQYLEVNRIQIELFNSEKLLAENKAKHRSERLLFISLLVFMLILTFVLIWIFRIRSVKNRQQKIILEKERQIIEQQSKEKETLALLKQEQLNNEKLKLKQQLKEQETLALLEWEKLNNEIDAKNRQLTAKILSHSNRHEWINEILQSLLAIPEDSRDVLLNSIILNLKIQLKDSSEWDTFLNHFEEMNPSLLMALKNKYPNLTANDIQLISCIYLDLDTKKIAHLLNISTDACWKKKQRLANKLGITISKLRNYLKNIEQYPLE